MSRLHLPTLVAAATLLACSDSGTAPEAAVGRDLLLITIDTLRPDFLGCYGHPRPSTSTTIDGLAASGTLFEQAYTTAPMTGPAHATMLSGRYSAEHGLLRNGLTFDPAVPRLPEVLGDAGYTTAAVLGARVIDSRFGFDQGFEYFDDKIGQRRTKRERRAAEVVDSAIAMLEERDGSPVFVWAHFYDPHAPYQAPPPSRDWIVEGIELYGPRVEPGPEYDAQALIDLAWKYEAEILATDRQLARLLEAWDSDPRGRDGVVCLTSDHGEGLGEHSYLEHGLELWEEQLLVPLILRAPNGVPASLRVATPVSLIDLPRTLLGLCGVDGGDRLGGQDLLALMSGGPAPRSILIAERPDFPDVEGEAARLWAAQDIQREHRVSVLRDDSKYVWREGREPQLFDLAADPAEAHDLADSAADRVQSLATDLERWRASLERIGEGQRVEDQDTLDMLEALGYR